MDIRESIKNTLNESNLTNPSKLYTPFTLFAVYFAIYFKADVLGRIFLSDNWAVTEKALTDLKNPGVIEWFTFSGEVAAYSIGMLFLYGLAQIIAVSIWATSNKINTAISAFLHQGKYVSSTVLEKAEQKIEELRADNKKLYSELATYHTWRPEDIARLEEDLISSNKKIEELDSRLREEIEHSRKISNDLSSEISIRQQTAESLIDYISINSENTKKKDALEILKNREDLPEIISEMKSIFRSNLKPFNITIPTERPKLPFIIAILDKFKVTESQMLLRNGIFVSIHVNFKENSEKILKVLISILEKSESKTEAP